MAELHGAEIKAQDQQHLRDGRCPECQIDLTAVNPLAHAEDHWPSETMNNHVGSDGARRKRELIAYAKRNEIEAEYSDLGNQALIEHRVAELVDKHLALAMDQAKAKMAANAADQSKE